jgi:tetratricopeptide (TPR) repeat protein
LKRPQEAVREYETAARLAPEDALLQVQLGEARRDAGDTAGAVAALRQAVQIDPEASYWNSLGMVLGAAGQLSEAEQAFREAVQRADRNAEYAYNLGLVLLRQGRVEDAAASFRRAADLDPGFPAPRQRLAELGRR